MISQCFIRNSLSQGFQDPNNSRKIPSKACCLKTKVLRHLMRKNSQHKWGQLNMDVLCVSPSNYECIIGWVTKLGKWDSNHTSRRAWWRSSIGKISARPDDVSHRDCTKSRVAWKTPFRMWNKEYFGRGGFSDDLSAFTVLRFGDPGRFCTNLIHIKLSRVPWLFT